MQEDAVGVDMQEYYPEFSASVSRFDRPVTVPAF